MSVCVKLLYLSTLQVSPTSVKLVQKLANIVANCRVTPSPPGPPPPHNTTHPPFPSVPKKLVTAPARRVAARRWGEGRRGGWGRGGEGALGWKAEERKLRLCFSRGAGHLLYAILLREARTGLGKRGGGAGGGIIQKLFSSFPSYIRGLTHQTEAMDQQLDWTHCTSHCTFALLIIVPSKNQQL